MQASELSLNLQQSCARLDREQDQGSLLRLRLGSLQRSRGFCGSRTRDLRCFKPTLFRTTELRSPRPFCAGVRTSWSLVSSDELRAVIERQLPRYISCVLVDPGGIEPPTFPVLFGRGCLESLHRTFMIQGCSCLKNFAPKGKCADRRGTNQHTTVDRKGIEPLTFCMPYRCSTN